METDEKRIETLSIDVSRVIYRKKKKLHNLLPTFFINYLRHIIHEEELNENILNHKELKNIDFVNMAISYFQYYVYCI
jgi:hypothetical protein